MKSGLSNVFHVQLGTAALVFEGIVFFVFLIIRRDLVHLGTLAWCFLIGPFENVWLGILDPILPVASEMSVGLKIVCILLGSAIIIVTLAYYIPIGLGYQTSDIFAFIAADIVKKSYGIGLIISYAILFVIGVALGSSWGIGTLIAVVAYEVLKKVVGVFVLTLAIHCFACTSFSYVLLRLTQRHRQLLLQHLICNHCDQSTDSRKIPGRRRSQIRWHRI